VEKGGNQKFFFSSRMQFFSTVIFFGRAQPGKMPRFSSKTINSVSVYRQKMPRFSYNATRLPSVHNVHIVHTVQIRDYASQWPLRKPQDGTAHHNKSPRSGVSCEFLSNERSDFRGWASLLLLFTSSLLLPGLQKKIYHTLFQ